MQLSREIKPYQYVKQVELYQLFRIMKKLLLFTITLLSSLTMLTSCIGNDSAEGVKGKLKVAIVQSAVFTRAVDFTELQNTGNYTIDIFDASGVCTVSKKVSELTDNSVELEEGSYRIVAHYGEEKAASQNTLCMKGEQAFTIKAGSSTDINVVCTPSCAKVSVNFDENMSTYFSDYYVTYTTKALSKEGTTAVWSKSNRDPWYLLVEEQETVKATIHVTRASDGKTATIEREHVLYAAGAWTLGIQAEEKQDPNGSVTISISIDDTTNDIEQTIVVPNEWWS